MFFTCFVIYLNMFLNICSPVNFVMHKLSKDCNTNTVNQIL